MRPECHKNRADRNQVSAQPHPLTIATRTRDSKFIHPRQQADTHACAIQAKLGASLHTVVSKLGNCKC